MLLPHFVFGSTCFVHDLILRSDKLSVRVVKSVFLGYFRVRKGYRCYCSITYCIYVSIDVTFFENTMSLCHPLIHI